MKCSLFVESKKTSFYIWLAIDRHSRAIVGCFIGDRTRRSARKLWASLPYSIKDFLSLESTHLDRHQLMFCLIHN